MIFMASACEPGFITLLILYYDITYHCLHFFSFIVCIFQFQSLTKQWSWCVIEREYVSASSSSSAIGSLAGISNRLGLGTRMKPAPTVSRISWCSVTKQASARKDLQGINSFHSLSPSTPVSSYSVGNSNFTSFIGTSKRKNQPHSPPGPLSLLQNQNNILSPTNCCCFNNLAFPSWDRDGKLSNSQNLPIASPNTKNTTAGIASRSTLFTTPHIDPVLLVLSLIPPLSSSSGTEV